LEDGGGGLVGYFLAVFEADSFEAVFAAFDVDEPIPVKLKVFKNMFPGRKVCGRAHNSLLWTWMQSL
jgi:hypothetical protein